MKSKLIRSLELGSACVQNTHEKCRAANFRNTVRDETWDSYASEARPMVIAHRAKFPGFGLEEGEATMETLKGELGADLAMFYIAHNIDRHFFSQYIYARSVRGIRSGSARCALLKAQDVFGQRPWAGDKDVILETDGADSKAAEMSTLQPPVGSITQDMLHQLLAHVTHAHAGAVRMAMIVQFGAALRYDELKRLRVKDVKSDGIYLVHTKTMKARYDYRLPTPFKRISHWPCGLLALETLYILTIGKSPDTVLFPSTAFTMSEYNAQIKAAAKACGWTGTVRFRGSHSLRHGGVGAAKDALKGVCNEEEIAATLLMSLQMVDHYAATNSEKYERYIRKLEKKQVWANSHQGVISEDVWASNKRDREDSPNAEKIASRIRIIEKEPEAYTKRGPVTSCLLESNASLLRFLIPEQRDPVGTAYSGTRSRSSEGRTPGFASESLYRFLLP